MPEAPLSSPPLLPFLPPAPPPQLPAPVLEAASYTAIVSSALSLLATVLAYLHVIMSCCRRQRRLPSTLLLIALGAMPSNIARVVTGSADLLPHNSTLVLWADEWRCHSAGHATGGDGTLNERNCAVVAMAHVISTSAPLWAASLALHFIGGTICCVTGRSGCGRRCMTHCARWLCCVGLPLLICALLAADRACDATNLPHLAQWATHLCNTTHAPHFDSWAGLAGGIASSGAAARDGDVWPLCIYGTPFALAIVTSSLALLFGPATCAIERVHAQHSRVQLEYGAAAGSPAAAIKPAGRRRLEPLCASYTFLAVSVPVWILPLARAATQLWIARPPAASEALPWLGVFSSALHPCMGVIAILCWACGARRAARTATSSTAGGTLGAEASHVGNINADDMRTGLLQADNIPARPASSSSRALTMGAAATAPRLVAATTAQGSAIAAPGVAPLLPSSSVVATADVAPTVMHPSNAMQSSLVGRGAEASPISSGGETTHIPVVPQSSDLARVAADYANAQPQLVPSPENLRVPKPKAGWLYKEGHVNKGWKRRWCVVENGLFQYFESFDSPADKSLGLVPLQGATIRDPKTARRRSSLGGPTVGPAWRLDTGAREKDAFHRKYILAGTDAASSQSWKEAIQVHIEFANDAAQPQLVHHGLASDWR